MDAPPFTMHVSLPGTAAAFLADLVAAELAGEGITASCAHPVTADRLYLPSWVLMCSECAETARIADRQPGPCSACTVDGARAAVVWVHEPGHILVAARVCQDCGTNGNVALCLN